MLLLLAVVIAGWSGVQRLVQAGEAMLAWVYAAPVLMLVPFFNLFPLCLFLWWAHGALRRIAEEDRAQEAPRRHRRRPLPRRRPRAPSPASSTRACRTSPTERCCRSACSRTSFPRAWHWTSRCW